MDAATSLFRQDGPCIAQLLEGNYFSNAAKSRITTNLQQEVKEYVYTFMYPEEYTLTESISKTDFHSSTSVEEALDDSKVKMRASESCNRLQRNLKKESFIIVYSFWWLQIFSGSPNVILKRKRSL